MASPLRSPAPGGPLSAPPSARNSGLVGAPEPIAALNRVRITELATPWQDHEPLVDIRTFCPDVACADSVCPYLRRTAAEMLNRAQDSLPRGYKLSVGTLLRTLSMQKGGWDRFHEKVRKEHPTWPNSALRRATNRYFAPYDQKAPPGHCTGGAVDVSLIDADGATLDMTSPTTGWEAAYTWSDKISAEARTNRMRMVEAMLDAGFSNCRDEYWHYSWGDSAWAVRVGERECPYGWAFAPPTLAVEIDGESPREVLLQTERDFSGRPLSARSADTIHAGASSDEAIAAIRLRINWCSGIPVTLRIALRADQAPRELFLGDGKGQWSPIATDRFEEGAFSVVLTPDVDRAILTTSPTIQTSESAP